MKAEVILQSQIRAIETVYNGYRFRSRLEARWAVFFDKANIKYEYEKEGYVFSDGTKYLPDFWLPQINSWAEVKPYFLTEDERKKVYHLVDEHCTRILILVGLPSVSDPFLVLYKDESGIHSKKEYFNNKNYYVNKILGYAALSAKQARFEHGERGV